MQRTHPPAVYWVAWVGVLAALGAGLNALYGRWFSWWGAWELGGVHGVHRLIVLAVTLGLYAALIYVAYTKADRIMQPFINAVRFFNEVWTELQRVVWPSHEETYTFTVVVIIALLIVAAWVAILDWLCVILMSGLLGAT